MSESQTEYETSGPTFDSTPWEAEGPPLTGEAVDPSSGAVWAADGDLVAETHASPVYGEPSYDRARLLAAAGSAASELPDEYDAVALLRVLPQLVNACEEARHIMDTSGVVDASQSADVARAITKALDAARKDTTDE